jgi:50S ribosomal subunit-associated GTPase HflX
MAGAWLLGAGARAAGEGPPKAVLVAAAPEDETSEGAPGTETSLRELQRLAATDGLAVVDTLAQSRGRPDPATYIGSGKARELAAAVERCAADVVIADGELSPAQTRNLRDQVGVPVVDRTALILDIFAEHARTSEGRLQVEPAQIAYQLPRLRERAADRSTLEEVTHADLTLIVVDASAPDALSQITIVHGVLHEIGAGEVPEVLVLNKIDVAPPEWVAALRRVYPDALCVSAMTGEGVTELRASLATRLHELARTASHT